ncbi:MAG: branched-chain amino acid ABC transporter permease [Actinobacteria bacterium]|nr:branched-chain amino acid ABC transporter permease [Actinomycetota bacterium]
MNYFIEQTINGITLGGLYALVALGYTMVYGILMLINFAHSEMFMLGGYIGLLSLKVLSDPSLAEDVGLGFLEPAQAFFNSGTIGFILMLVVTFLVSGALVGVVGMITERFAYRPLRKAPRLAPLISAIGISIFLQNAVLLWVSSKQLPYSRADGTSFVPVKTAFTFMGVEVSTMQVLIIVTSITLLLALDTFIARTRVGRAMRATAQDRDAAGLMGVDVNRVIMLAFFIGPALGAVAGIFNGMYYGSVKYNMGFIPGVKSFTAAVIGGIGNLRGAMLGGFLLGIIESLASGFISHAYRDVIAFIVLIVVLVVRPGGLLGESVTEKV